MSAYRAARDRPAPHLRGTQPRVLVTGATGFLGTHLVRRLLAEGARVRVLARAAPKAQAEALVDAAAQEGVPAVIVRPGLVYGPGDLHLLGFFRAIQRRQFRPLGRRSVWLHPIYIDDMTEALLRCGHHPRAVGDCFHLAGPEPVTIARLAATIASAEGVAPPRSRIPLPAARAVALAGDVLPARLQPLAPLTRSRLDFLTHSRVYSVAKARQVLDFTATTDLPTGIAHSVAWYRRYGHL